MCGKHLHLNEGYFKREDDIADDNIMYLTFSLGSYFSDVFNMLKNNLPKEYDKFIYNNEYYNLFNCQFLYHDDNEKPSGLILSLIRE
ncbi:MAG: hypothetical protein ACOCRK_00990 [bacterium]